jgi:hypothetical protein
MGGLEPLVRAQSDVISGTPTPARSSARTPAIDSEDGASEHRSRVAVCAGKFIPPLAFDAERLIKHIHEQDHPLEQKWNTKRSRRCKVGTSA